MSKAIQILMDEHRVIERVLSSLETFVGRIGTGSPETERQALRDFGRFFREFADRSHHAKEEDRLFTAMAAHGFPKEFGPIAVMLHEHVEGRNHVGALVAAGERTGPLGSQELDIVRAHALAFIPLLQDHILKEDNVLYPMAKQALPGAAMDQLAKEFADHDRTVMGPDASTRYHALVEALAAQYPPAPARPGRSCGSGCGHSMDV